MAIPKLELFQVRVLAARRPVHNYSRSAKRHERYMYYNNLILFLFCFVFFVLLPHKYVKKPVI